MAALYILFTTLFFVSFLFIMIGISNIVFPTTQVIRQQGKQILKWSMVAITIQVAILWIVREPMEDYMVYQFHNETIVVSTETEPYSIEYIKRQTVTCDAYQITGDYDYKLANSIWSESYTLLSSFKRIPKGKVELSLCEKHHESNNKK